MRYIAMNYTVVFTPGYIEWAFCVRYPVLRTKVVYRDVVQKCYLSVIYFLFFFVLCAIDTYPPFQEKSGDSHSNFSRLHLVILYRRQYRIVIK